MLGAPSLVRGAMDEEDIALVRILPPEVLFRFHNLRYVVDQRFGIPVSFTEDAQDVRDSVHREREVFLRPHLDRAIDEIIVMGSREGPPIPLEARRHVPVLERIDGERQRIPPESLGVHKYGGAVDECMVFVESARAQPEFIRIDRVPGAYFFAPLCPDPPERLFELPPTERFSSSVDGSEVLHSACEVEHEVTPLPPNRQDEIHR